MARGAVCDEFAGRPVEFLCGDVAADEQVNSVTPVLLSVVVVNSVAKLVMSRFGEPGHRSTHSVGGVPFYIPGSTPTYPTVASRTKLEVMRNSDGFGEKVSCLLGYDDAACCTDLFTTSTHNKHTTPKTQCTHTDLPAACTSDAECHAATHECHPIGKICVQRNAAGCGAGGAGGERCWCYVHSDCDDIPSSGEDLMCAGTGRCVKPIIEIR